jgi:Flp pilus assembly protein protease CpaA
MLLIAIVIAFVALVIASVTDIYNREVPDYVSYGLMFVAGAIAVLYSIINQDYIYLVQSAMGFVIGLVIAYAMFYLGQWGGGDSKLMMGLGAIIGFNIFPIFGRDNFWLLILLVNIILFGAVYGLVWSIALAFRNRKAFMKSLDSWMHKRYILRVRRIVMIAAVLLLLVAFLWVPEEFKAAMIAFVALFYIMFYLWLFVKIIEESCMVKDILVNKLTEGDWIYKDVYIGKKKIAGPKDLGISREQIELLKRYARKGKIKTVTIKEGIPFIPAFLVAFSVTILLWYLGIF